MNIDKKSYNIFLKTISKDLTKFNLAYGFFDDKNQTHENGEKSSQIAFSHIKGDPARHLPKRDFAIEPILEKKEKIVKETQNALNNTKNNKNFMYPVLKHIGDVIIDISKQTINNNGNGNWKKLSQKTIDKKGNDRMLRDTDKMYNDYQSKVIKK